MCSLFFGHASLRTDLSFAHLCLWNWRPYVYLVALRCSRRKLCSAVSSVTSTILHHAIGSRKNISFNELGSLDTLLRAFSFEIVAGQDVNNWARSKLSRPSWPAILRPDSLPYSISSPGISCGHVGERCILPVVRSDRTLHGKFCLFPWRCRPSFSSAVRVGSSRGR